MVVPVISPLLSVVFQKLTSPILQEFAAAVGVHEELEKLRRTLLRIKSMLGDAEGRQIMDEALNSWLAALKDAAYDADDILDVFNTEVLRKQFHDNMMINKVRDLFSFHNPILFRFKIGHRLKNIVERIDELAAESRQFNFALDRQTQKVEYSRPPTHSYVDDSHVIGREEDTDKVVDLLIQQKYHDNVAVVSIVGMGGLGKTTIAQLIYNDPKVQNYFQLRIWVCVSDDFDVAKLAKAIVDAASGRQCDISNMELLQRNVRDLLCEKRYLLVLDDVWNQDAEKWDMLKVLLDCGNVGSRIMVTTRSNHVSVVMGASTTYQLPCLSEDDSWTLFKQRAFTSEVQELEHPNLVAIGREINRRCGGLPLAVKTLGSLMRSKSREEEWLLVKNSDLCDTQVGQDGILPVLRLSYNQLPSYMKQCFAFCAVFPKDHEMDKEMLIQLWMANGFIPSEGRMEMDVKGSVIFDELVWRSFLQDVREVNRNSHTISDYTTYNIITCKMHDLMHELAQSVLRNECLTVSGYQQPEEAPKGIRHFSAHGVPFSSIPTSIKGSSTLHTFFLPERYPSLFMEPPDKLKFKYLRVLDLHRCSVSQRSISLSKLIHVRYLDLSRTKIDALPEEITRQLVNLQTLRLIGCNQLCKLPKGLRNMRSLRHLYIHGCEKLVQMPAGIGELKHLRTLTKYVVGSSSSGTGIEELKNLSLGCLLELYNLENVSNGHDAAEANLSSKINLRSLALCWGVTECWHWSLLEEALRPVENAVQVIEALKPAGGLKELVIWNYGGLRFPLWMSDSLLLHNLIEVRLMGCRSCEHLPALGKLPLLKLLFLTKIDAKHIYHADNTISISGETDERWIAFPSLQRISIIDMKNLKEFCKEEVGRKAASQSFPCLSSIYISRCPNLTSVPSPSSLRELHIEEGCSTLVKCIIGVDLEDSRPRCVMPFPNVFPGKGMFRHLKALKVLSIEECDELAPLLEDEEETRVFNTSLWKLAVGRCNMMFAPQRSSSHLGLWKNLNCLKFLFITNCDALIYWPEEELRVLNSLKRLHVIDCPNLTGAPQPSSSSDDLGPRNLEELHISSCHSLTELPRCPASLRILYIYDSSSVGLLTLKYPEDLAALHSLSVSECSSLVHLPDWLGCLTALRDVTISGCPRLMSFPDGMDKIALLRLSVKNCPGLLSFPDGLRQILHRLHVLEISGCPALEKMCKRGGKYSHLISKIPDLRILREKNSVCGSFF